VKEIEVSTAVHGSFDEFQSMDLPFDRPIAPRQGESREEGYDCRRSTNVVEYLNQHLGHREEWRVIGADGGDVAAVPLLPLRRTGGSRSAYFISNPPMHSVI
jgi:hypothetical protein